MLLEAARVKLKIMVSRNLLPSSQPKIRSVLGGRLRWYRGSIVQ